jgi:hypothetical protein
MPQLTYKDKIFKHKLTVLYRIVLGILLLVAVIIIIKIQFDSKVYTEVEALDELDKMGAENAIYREYQGNILVYSNDGISTYDAKGKQIWNKTYEMQSPIVKTNGSYVACGDYKGNKIYIMDAAGATGEVETNMPIMDLDVSAKGIVAATLQDDETIWIKLYSQTGEEISNVKTTMKKSGYPIATAVSADNVKLGVSYLKAQSGSINTSVAFYNFGDVGQNNTDHLVSGKDYSDTMIPFLAYVDDNEAVALSENQLLIFKGKEKPTLDVEVDLEEEVQSIYYSDRYIALIFNNTQSNESYRLDLYNMSGDKLFSYIFDIDYQDIMIRKDQILIYSESEAIILNKKGLVKYEGDMGGDIVSVIPTESATTFIIVRGNQIETVKLH